MPDHCGSDSIAWRCSFHPLTAPPGVSNSSSVSPKTAWHEGSLAATTSSIHVFLTSSQTCDFSFLSSAWSLMASFVWVAVHVGCVSSRVTARPLFVNECWQGMCWALLQPQVCVRATAVPRHPWSSGWQGADHDGGRVNRVHQPPAWLLHQECLLPCGQGVYTLAHTHTRWFKFIGWHFSGLGGLVASWLWLIG